MRHAAVKELFRYWNDLRGERAAPERNDMDPNAIRHILADTFVLDIDEARLFPFRLSGTRVNALFGAEQKGRSFLEMWRKEEAQNLAGVLLTVADGACPVVAGTVASVPGEADVALELLVLPIRNHGKTHARLLGILTPLKTPAWLGDKAVGDMTLRSLRVVDAEKVSAPRARGEAVRPLIPAARDRRDAMLGKKTGVPFLQVIEGGGQSGVPQGVAGLSRLHHKLAALHEESGR